MTNPASTSAAWNWWARFWSQPPPIRGLAVFAAIVLALFGWLVVLLVYDRYFGTKRYRVTSASGPLNVHHARWMPVKNADVTAFLQDAAKAGRFNLPATVKRFGDPFYGELKELVVTYSTSDGIIQTVVVKEDQRLRIP